MVLAPLQGASGQALRVLAGEPIYAELYSPIFDGTAGKKFNPKAWLEVEAMIQVEMRPVPPTKSCDRLTVKWYLVVENPEKPRSKLLITKEVEHINIPLDEEVYVSAYMSPASVAQVIGSNRNVSKMVELLGYEVIYKGEVKAAVSSDRKLKAGWWNIASENLSRTATVNLLNKTQTPFAHLWWDRYAEVDITKK